MTSAKMEELNENFRLEGAKLENALKETKEKSKKFLSFISYYRCAIMEIETKLNVLREEFSLCHDRNPINGISSRLKTPQSILEKLKRKNKKQTLQNAEKYVNDIAGVRVCCMFTEDVYMLADAVLKQDDVTLIEKRDYIANPKPNGYRSLHLLVSVPIFLSEEKRSVKVEIQFRTIAMDFWASVEHQLRYKKNNEFTKEMADELLLCAKTSADLDERMENLKKLIEK